MFKLSYDTKNTRNDRQNLSREQLNYYRAISETTDVTGSPTELIVSAKG